MGSQFYHASNQGCFRSVLVTLFPGAITFLDVASISHSRHINVCCCCCCFYWLLQADLRHWSAHHFLLAVILASVQGAPVEKFLFFRVFFISGFKWRWENSSDDGNVDDAPLRWRQARAPQPRVRVSPAAREYFLCRKVFCAACWCRKSTIGGTGELCYTTAGGEEGSDRFWCIALLAFALYFGLRRFDIPILMYFGLEILFWYFHVLFFSSWKSSGLSTSQNSPIFLNHRLPQNYNEHFKSSGGSHSPLHRATLYSLPFRLGPRGTVSSFIFERFCLYFSTPNYEKRKRKKLHCLIFGRILCNYRLAKFSPVYQNTLY